MFTKEISSHHSSCPAISRRAFLCAGSGLAALSLAAGKSHTGIDVPPDYVLSFGAVTDLHHADKDTWGTRHYRDSAAKLTEAVKTMNARNADFVINLGDLIDGAEKSIEYGYIKTIDAILDSMNGKRHYVIGNHDVATFAKAEYLKAVGAAKNYYSFDLYGWHFVVLDANYNADGSSYNAGNFTWTETYVPEAQLRWLENDLANAPEGAHTMAFIHQNLHNEEDAHGVKNAPEVRAVLERAGNVRAVLQGHMHTGAYKEIAGIHYLTLRAGVEGEGLANNAFSIVQLAKDGSVMVEGFGQQKSFVLASK